MSTVDVWIVVAPIVVLAVVGTVFQTKRAGAATRFLSSTVGRVPADAPLGPRVRCGVSVRRPGRMNLSYPLCELAVAPQGVVVFGPTNGRMAEFCDAPGLAVEVSDALMRQVTVSSKEGRVVVAVRAKDATALDSWLSQITMD